METNKIYQGDCLELMKQIDDKSIDLILCDLPYGTTACKWDTIIPFEPLWEQYKRIIKDNGVIVLTASQPFTTDLINSNRTWFKYCWIWEKNLVSGFLNAKKQPLRKYEDIVVFYLKQPKYNPILVKKDKESIRWNNIEQNGITEIYGKIRAKQKRYEFRDIAIDLKYPSNILRFSTRNNKIHRDIPTQKPVALFEYLIKTYTNEGDLVLDNCIGSGTTAIACINTKRNFIGIELSPEYCKISNERIQKELSQTKLNSEGKFFSSQP